MNIYLDESGQFAKKASGVCFVIGSFTVGDPRRTEKQFRSWQVNHFPKRMRHQPEIKFSEVKIKDDLRVKTLKFIANLDVRIRYVFLKRANIPFDYWQKERLQSGLLYTNIIGELLDLYLPNDDSSFHAFCDQRDLGGLTKRKFEELLMTRLITKMPSDADVKVKMCDSAQNRNIQIADWIVGALACHCENKQLGREYFRILKNNLLGEGKELFGD